jgi:excisionase family DNA binding protein
MSTTEDVQLKVEEIARRDDTCKATVWRQIKRGELPAHRIGRHRRIWQSDWLNRRKAGRGTRI